MILFFYNYYEIFISSIYRKHYYIFQVLYARVKFVPTMRFVIIANHVYWPTEIHGYIDYIDLPGADLEGGQRAMAPPNRWITMLHNLFKVGKSIGLSMKDLFFCFLFFFCSLPFAINNSPPPLQKSLIRP